MRKASRLATIVFLTLGFQTLSAQDNLATLKGKYETYVQSLSATYTSQFELWSNNYLAALQALQARAQTAGQLDTLLALRDEETRFRATHDIPPDAVVAQPEALRALQTEYASKPATLTANRSRDLVAVTTKYAERLDDLSKRLTTEGQIEAAVAARDERDQLLKSPAFTAAQFELAVQDVAKPTDKPAVPHPGDPKSGTPPADDPNPNAAIPFDSGTVRGVGIYKGTAAPPAPRTLGINLKANPFVRTGPSPLRSGIILRPQQGTKQDDNENWHLRLTLRTEPARGVILRPMVVAQFYVKDNRKSSQERPQLYITKRIRLESLGSTPVTLDYPPVVVNPRRHRSGSGEWQDGGRTVVGAIITIYDQEDVLLHQESSSRTLLELASARLPERTNEERMEELQRNLADAQKQMSQATRAMAEKPDNAEVSAARARIEAQVQNLKRDIQRMEETRKREGW